MLKKYFTVACLGLFLVCGAAFGGAVSETQEQAIAAQLAAMANEPPLTQGNL